MKISSGYTIPHFSNSNNATPRKNDGIMSPQEMLKNAANIADWGTLTNSSSTQGQPKQPPTDDNQRQV